MMACRLLDENDRAHFMTRRFDRQIETKQPTQTLCAMQHPDFSSTRRTITANIFR